MEDKLNILKARLKEYKRVVVAFSGGVDSTFLARVAKDVYGDNLLLITATSSTNPFYELEEAKALASMMEIEHRIIVTEEIDNPEYFNQTNEPKFQVNELVSQFDENFLGGVVSIKSKAVVSGNSSLEVRYIPYYSWANRGDGKMKVWLPVK